ncbi:MAG TPA: hypothetical protein PKK99_03555 [Bacteroidia bacterium]|nr:hypothetical protein [Bacteroidia bacterium]
MLSSQEERILIERYLSGALSGLELQQFMERLEQDHAFQQRVSFQNLLQEGIAQADDIRLEEMVASNLGYRKSRIPFGLKLIVTFLLITVLGIIVWDYVGTNSNTTPKNYFTFSFLKKEKESSSSEKPEKQNTRKRTEVIQETKNEESVENIPPSETNSTDENSSGEGAPSSQDKVNNSDSTHSEAGASPDIVIKKDQLLMSVQISAAERNNTGENSPSKEGASATLSQNAIDKLNPAAGLVEKDQPSSNYDVEFWVSPINYRGYKLIKNKLILFGIEEPDAVKLFLMDGNLFMKYGNEYYRLWSGAEFMAYKRIRENDLPLTTKQ